MKYKIHTKCLNDPKISEELYLGRTDVFNERTIYDAACCALEQMAEEVQQIENRPVNVRFEASGVANDGEPVFYQGIVKYEPFHWEKKYGDSPWIFDEEGIEPYSIDIIPVKPTKAESDFLQILMDAFPEYDFKYEQESFYCRLGGEWVNIFDSIKDMPESEGERYWMTLSGLETEDDALRAKYYEFKMIRRLIERVRCSFFRQQRVDLNINRIPTFLEFLEM